MKKTYRNALIVGSVIFLLITGAIIYWSTRPTSSFGGSAVSTFSPQSCYTSSSTSTLNYMTPGTATTTLACPLGEFGADSAVLNMTFVGSSSPLSVFNIDIQYSQGGNGADCTLNPSPCDWSPVAFSTLDYPYLATSSPSLSTVQQFTFPFASSTISRGAVTNLNSATTTRLIVIPTPTRYVRAIFSITGANGAVQAQFLPRKSQ